MMSRSRTGWLVWPLACLAIVGCHSPLFRGQSPDAQLAVVEESGTTLVGDLTLASGMNPIEINGVGLVTGLDNTGSAPAPSPERDALLDEMQTHNVDQPQTVLDSKRTALVLVRGFLPPGVQKGDRFDLEVVAPPRSETTSLRGGWLMQTRLRQTAILNNAVHKGDVDSIGGGDVIVDAMYEDSENKRALLRGRVLGGGASLTTRKLGLVLKENVATVQASTRISSVVNARFFHYDRGTKQGVAKPINSKYIELAVPPRYRHNVTRYMKVVRNIAVNESMTERAIRLQQLEAKLLEPTTSYSAALQLEGLGKEGVGVLRKGLLSSDLEIRFYAAEALAYLDDVEAAPVLAEAASKERAFRWHALGALSTMDHVAAYDALNELLSDVSAETRYGAFRAMQTRNPRDPMVRGEVLGQAFAFHEIVSTSDPLIHFSRAGRPEIVLFGFHQQMQPPAFLLAGKRIMLKRQDDQHIRVIRFEAGEDDRELICSTNLAEIIRAMVELGGSYEDVYQALRSAKSGGYLSSRIVVDARASSVRRYRRGSDEPSGEEGEADELPSRYHVPSPIPDLFSDPLDRSDERGEGALDYEESSTAPEPEPGFFDRIKGWWKSDTATH